MQLHCVIALQCKSEQISVVDSTWQIGSIFADQANPDESVADFPTCTKIVDDQIFEYADFSFLLVSNMIRCQNITLFY